MTRQRRWPRAHQAISSTLSAIQLIAFVALLFCLHRTPASPVLDQWLLLAVLLALQLPTLVRSMIQLWACRSAELQTVGYPRPNLYHVRRTFFQHLPLLFVLWISYGRMWVPEGIGFARQIDWRLLVCVCIPAAILLRTVPRFIASRIFIASRLASSSSESHTLTAFDAAVIRGHLPRGRLAQWLLALHTVFVSPVMEEMTYRGFFVYYIGDLIGLVPGIVCGWVLCVWIHLYQGPSNVIPITAFYFISVALLYSPAGLLGAILFHVAGNAYYQAHAYVTAKQYLQYVIGQRTGSAESA